MNVKMIYYDSYKNKFITIDKKDLDIKFTINNNISNRSLSSECELTIRFDETHLNYFKEWISYTNQRVMYVSEYKRDIFISDSTGVDTKLCNCFVSSLGYDIESPYNKYEVILKCDYYEKGGVYPELKSIYRDKKIDLILSK